MSTSRYRWSLWSDSAQRYTPLTIKYDEETQKVLTPFRNIAAHSSHGWGEWHTSQSLKVSVGKCWNVSTGGHGGFILVTQEKLPFVPDASRFPRLHDLSLYSGQAYEYIDGAATLTWPAPERLVCPLYVYEFEEDCAWAVLLYHDRTALEAYVDYRNGWRVPRGEQPETVDEFYEYVLSTVKHWHPEQLEAA